MTDSGDESEIEEDPSFPLPRPSDQESDSDLESEDEPPFCPPQTSDESNSDINCPHSPRHTVHGKLLVLRLPSALDFFFSLL